MSPEIAAMAREMRDVIVMSNLEGSHSPAPLRAGYNAQSASGRGPLRPDMKHANTPQVAVRVRAARVLSPLPASPPILAAASETAGGIFRTNRMACLAVRLCTT